VFFFPLMKKNRKIKAAGAAYERVAYAELRLNGVL
jgi:hypothetical protein